MITVKGAPVQVDEKAREVFVRGKEISCTPKEFGMLVMLMKRPGEILSRELVLKEVWGHDESLELSTRTVDQHLARLRKNLGPAGKFIVTVPSFGYKFKRPMVARK